MNNIYYYLKLFCCMQSDDEISIGEIENNKTLDYENTLDFSDMILQAYKNGDIEMLQSYNDFISEDDIERMFEVSKKGYVECIEWLYNKYNEDSKHEIYNQIVESKNLNGWKALYQLHKKNNWEFGIGRSIYSACMKYDIESVIYLCEIYKNFEIDEFENNYFCERLCDEIINDYRIESCDSVNIFGNHISKNPLYNNHIVNTIIGYLYNFMIENDLYKDLINGEYYEMYKNYCKFCDECRFTNEYNNYEHYKKTKQKGYKNYIFRISDDTYNNENIELFNWLYKILNRNNQLNIYENDNELFMKLCKNNDKVCANAIYKISKDENKVIDLKQIIFRLNSAGYKDTEWIKQMMNN